MEKVVVLPIAPYISNEYVAKIIEYNPKRLCGFASVIPNPAEQAIKQLKHAILDLKLRGLKLHPGMQGFCLKSVHVWKVLRVAGELGVPVVIDAMLGDFSTLFFKGYYTPWINNVEDYSLLPFIAPSTTMILAHMGGSFHFENVLQIVTMPNIYVDTSYSIITIIDKVGSRVFAKYVRTLGAEKFIFGSDQVLNLTPEDLSAKKQIELINKLPLTDKEKKQILFENAIKILKL